MKYQTEIWYPLAGYGDRYEITKDGLVRTKERQFFNSIGRIVKIKPRLMSSRVDTRSGYPVTKLSKAGGLQGSQYIHRLLAKTFIPNPENKACVNHKDGNKYNNSLENLEWATCLENYHHAVRNKLIIPGQKREVINMCTGAKYLSVQEASRKEGVKYHLLKRLIKGELHNNTCLQAA